MKWNFRRAKYLNWKQSSGVMKGLGCCSAGSLMLSPIDLQPTSKAPRLAASMIPGPPPVMTTKSLSSSHWLSIETSLANARASS